MSRFVSCWAKWADLLTSELKPTQGRHRSGKSAFKHYQGVFFLLTTDNSQTTFYLLFDFIMKVGFSFPTRTHYYFSYNFQFITYNYGNHRHHREWLSNSSQQKRERPRDHLLSHLLVNPPRRPQPTKEDSTDCHKNWPKFKTPRQIMSELRQYHPSLRVLQIKQT